MAHQFAPTLVLAHQRPDALRRILRELDPARPTFISVDAPFQNNKESLSLVSECREIALAHCEGAPDRVKFRDTNFGLQAGVQAAVDWFFTTAEQGIIIEDDIRLSDETLRIFDRGLAAYSSEVGISSLGAWTLQPVPSLGTGSGLLTRRGKYWGWATWASRWTRFRNEWTKRQMIRSIATSMPLFDFSPLSFAYHTRNVLRAELKRVDTWDYQFDYWARSKGMVQIRILNTQTKNEGFGSGTHTISMPMLLADISTNALERQWAESFRRCSVRVGQKLSHYHPCRSFERWENTYVYPASLSGVRRWLSLQR